MSGTILEDIHRQVLGDQTRLTLHAHQEMVAEWFSLEDVYNGLLHGVILENYPEHRRGPCCLVAGTTTVGRPIHIVCTTSLSLLMIITVYEPLPPKWATPETRRKLP